MKDVDLDEDGDMLFFQWGTYDWGDGPSFQYDITRQFTASTPEVEAAIWELSVTLDYPPPGDASALGEGNQWCARPELLDEFRHFIEIAPATVFARRSVPARVEINFGEVD